MYFQWGVLVIKSTEQNPEGRILSDVSWKASKQTTQSDNVLLEIALCGKTEGTEKNNSVIQPEYKSQNSYQHRTEVTCPGRAGLTLVTHTELVSPHPGGFATSPHQFKGHLFPLRAPHPNLAKVPNTNILKIVLKKRA